jgi:hypothetical protein
LRYDPEQLQNFFENLSPEQIEEGNRKDHEEHVKQLSAFQAAYAEGRCYLCDSSFDDKRNEEPCLHWLLGRAKAKKKQFPKVFEKFDYHNVAAFLRWCANEEKFLKNINDLAEEKSERKVISYTIKWKNIEWTFDCSENDLSGHAGSHMDYPHFHFQMRIDGRQFINFNEFHFAFSDRDLFNLSLRGKPWFHQSFGSSGSGMQDAVSVDLQHVLEHTQPSTNEEDAQYHLSTFIEAGDKPLAGEEIYEIVQEAKRTNKTFAFVAQQRLKGRMQIQTIVSPAEDIPDIAVRTEHKPR